MLNFSKKKKKQKKKILIPQVWLTQNIHNRILKQ